MKEYNLISEELVPDEVLMVSTDVNRTIQSGYSELMGLYPPNDSSIEPFTSGMRVNVQDSFFLPFNVRDVEEINEQLGSAPVPENFTAKAIYLYQNPDINDDVSTLGCKYVESTIN